MPHWSEQELASIERVYEIRTAHENERSIRP